MTTIILFLIFIYLLVGAIYLKVSGWMDGELTLDDAERVMIEAIFPAQQWKMIENLMIIITKIMLFLIWPIHITHATKRKRG